MTRDIVDERLIGALHVRPLTASDLDRDRPKDHVAYQAGTLSALMDGNFDGDATLEQLLAHGDIGIGTVEALGGELVVLDGTAYLVDGNGRVTKPPPVTRTPFAVVCRFRQVSGFGVGKPTSLATVRRLIDEKVGDPDVLVGVRIDGSFSSARLRSVHRQQRPYPPLVEVTDHQTEWEIDRVDGTIVGFRFPDPAAAIDVPGHHLHLISNDRLEGGHVLDLQIEHGTVHLDTSDELHVELPQGVSLQDGAIVDRDAIARAEGGGESA